MTTAVMSAEYNCALIENKSPGYYYTFQLYENCGPNEILRHFITRNAIMDFQKSVQAFK